MIAAGVRWRMAGRGYTIFGTAIGRCGIAWSAVGVIGVQLAQAREIETRKRLFRIYPDARDLRPPPNVEIAIEGIAALLRNQPCDFSDVVLDMSGIPTFSRRVYEVVRTIPRGEYFTHGKIAARIGVPGASHSVAKAISHNPFMIIVPCHRVLEAGNSGEKISPHAGTISRRRLLSIEGAPSAHAKTLFDALLPIVLPSLQS
jgi:methylated-DNA-[protein]-cysteine S-methyltransferase